MIDVSRLPTNELADLFALVLCQGVEHLARRGLEQGYELHEEEIVGVRGRIDVLQSARRFLPVHGRAACSFDELTVNTLPSQIVKTTLGLLGGVPILDDGLRKRVRTLHRDLHDIDTIQVSTGIFRRVQLHPNNRFYRFLLDVCALVHGSWLMDQTSGSYRFRDFSCDEKAMAKVFQDFLFNFIRTEIPTWNVTRDRISWCATSVTDPELLLLPRMETDISLRCGRDRVIIDAKYYQETLSHNYGVAKVHSANLYQLMSYLTNAERKPGDALSGMLIYPRIDRTVRETYKIQGFVVRVC